MSLLPSRFPGHAVTAPWLRSRAALWCAFAVVNALLIGAILWRPDYPASDITDSYFRWTSKALGGGSRMGIDEPWVYPILAFVPLTAAMAAGPAHYLDTWLALVVAANAGAFALVLGRGRLGRGRRLAAWWWLAFTVALGPIALTRIDAFTVPLAIGGLLYAAGRPRVSAVLLTAATWVKVWPAALLLAATVASRRRRSVVLTAVATSALVAAGSLLAGSGARLLGFIGAQGARQLQLESPLALPFLWQLALTGRGIDNVDHPGIVFSKEMLTWIVDLPGSAASAAASAPAMAALLAGATVVGIVAVRRGTTFARLFPPLALSLVAALLLGNKVGSAQFTVWLAPPVVVGLAVRGRRFAIPALVAGGVAGCTLVLYPYLYGHLLRAEPGHVAILTAKVVGIAFLYAWGVRAAWTPATSRRTAPRSTRGSVAGQIVAR